MVPFRYLRRVLLAALPVAAALGCHTLVLTAGSSTSAPPLLRSADPSPDSVTLEIYWARLPLGEGHDEATFWDALHEHRIDAAARARLAKNGLRAGVFGGALPDEVARMLDPAGELDDNEAQLHETGVTRRVKQFRVGQQIDLQASDELPSAPLIWVTPDGRIEGKTFQQALPTYALNLTSIGKGRAALRLAPEMRYGAPRMRVSPDETGLISRQTMSRDSQVFDDLAIEVELSPGETLVVISGEGAGSRLGGYLHAIDESTKRRRAILIRVAQAPGERLYDEGA